MTNTFRVKSKVGRKQSDTKYRYISKLRGLKGFKVSRVDGDKIELVKKKKIKKDYGVEDISP